MKVFKKNKSPFIVVLCLMTLIIMAAISYGMTAEVKADAKITKDLAGISGLSEEKIYKLYESVHDWETLKENIFVYKGIFSFVQESTEGNRVFDSLKKYKAIDVLTVYEFIDKNGKDFKKAEEVWSQLDAGIPLDAILTDALDQMADKTYRRYQPADKEIIKKWLAEGHLPNAIMEADQIAMEKDIRIEEALKIVDEEAKRDEAELKETLYPDAQVISLKIKKGENIETLRGKDYKEIVEEVNRKADQLKKEDKDSKSDEDLKPNNNLSTETYENYKNQGFNQHEIENAIRLSEKSDASMDAILDYKKSGVKWEEVIQKYSMDKEGDEEQ